jgi:hypothetical protein
MLFQVETPKWRGLKCGGCFYANAHAKDAANVWDA